MHEWKQKYTLETGISKLLRRPAFSLRPAPVVLSLSAGATTKFVDRREPRILKGAVNVLVGVTVRSEWHLPLPTLLLLPTLIDLTSLKGLSELIFFLEYAYNLTTLLYFVKTTTPNINGIQKVTLRPRPSCLQSVYILCFITQIKVN